MPSPLDPVLLEMPELGAAASVLRALMEATRTLVVEFPEDVPHLGAAAARVAEGIPALAGEELVSPAILIRNMGAVAAALENAPSAAAIGGDVRRLLAAHAAELSRDEGDGAALAAAALARDVEAIAAIARCLGTDEMALITIADHSVRPALRAAAELVQSVVGEHPWTRGICPGCGAPPLLAELRGDGERWLRCGRCCFAWMFPRMECRSCGTRDHRLLGYLHLEGEAEHRRADRCDGCRTYLKAIAVLSPFSSEELLEADLATVALDLSAVERGYRRD